MRRSPVANLHPVPLQYGFAKHNRDDCSRLFGGGASRRQDDIAPEAK
jgi:hypothetical protein